jgi:hypothetical protein
MGKTADDLVGFNYPAGGGDDIGVYKQPENVNVQGDVYVNGQNVSELNISVGNVGKNAFKGVNPYGTKEMRGYGAATKGRKISGKQG